MLSFSQHEALQLIGPRPEDGWWPARRSRSSDLFQPLEEIEDAKVCRMGISFLLPELLVAFLPFSCRLSIPLFLLDDH